MLNSMMAPEGRPEMVRAAAVPAAKEPDPLLLPGEISCQV